MRTTMFIGIENSRKNKQATTNWQSMVQHLPQSFFRQFARNQACSVKNWQKLIWNALN